MNKVQKLNLKDKVDDGEMDLSLCEIQEVPVKDIAVYKKVYILDLSNNSLTTLPKSFAILKNILKLDLSRNKLKELPENFGELTRLKHLDLYKNDLKNLPLSFGELKSLRWLDLKDNPLVPAILTVAGQCLDTKQCQQCASQIVSFYKDIKEKVEEEKKQKEMECKKSSSTSNTSSDIIKVKSHKKCCATKHEAKPAEGNTSLFNEDELLFDEEGQPQDDDIDHSRFSVKSTLLKTLLFLFLIVFTLTAVKYSKTQFIEDSVKSFWNGLFNRTPRLMKSGGELTGNLFKAIHDGYGFLLMKILDNKSVNYISSKFKTMYGK